MNLKQFYNALGMLKDHLVLEDTEDEDFYLTDIFVEEIGEGEQAEKYVLISFSDKLKPLTVLDIKNKAKDLKPYFKEKIYFEDDMDFKVEGINLLGSMPRIECI